VRGRSGRSLVLADPDHGGRFAF